MSLRLPFIVVPVVVASAACAAEAEPSAPESDDARVEVTQNLEPQDTKETKPATKDAGSTWKLGNKVWADDWLAPK